MSQNYNYEQLPKGNYGLQLGDFNLITGQIVWGGAQWNLRTTEQAARDVANTWRQQSIDAAIAADDSITMSSNGIQSTPERRAFFYRPTELPQ